ncbi:MAG: helix-hairpin-helix domain-containing protein [Planctomycetota bacterium]
MMRPPAMPGLTGHLLVLTVLAIVMGVIAIDHHVAPQVQYVSPATRVSLNDATAAELALLPGIGPRRAEAMIQWRTLHGPWTNVDNVANVPGIGPITVAQIAPWASVEMPAGEPQP